MKRLFTFCLTFLGVYAVSNAQELYKPRDVQQAFKNETRSETGLPGKNYWQNHASYTIDITSKPPSRLIEGIETINYVNNSPDELKYLLFKMILNIHKPTAVRLRPESKDYFTDGIIIDSFNVGGKEVPWKEISYYNTVHPVALPAPLASKDSVQMKIKWHYDVSEKSNREGMIDPTTYFLAYFYPRVAVYDDYAGWDYTEFNDALEFYNDFNNYKVNITVPANYIVWGTGTLLNPDDVLSPAFSSRYKSSLVNDDVKTIASKQELESKKVTNQAKLNTWKFKANNISDVAFGLSDHFVWDASSVIVDEASKRRASVQAAYNDTAADFHNMVKYGRDALHLLSTTWPGIPYPFEKTTIFQGYAGMEYPMMANDETYADTTFSKFVAEHEIAHSYMPFYMGINETRYGFMDEGWATTFEYLLNKIHFGVERAQQFYQQFRVAGWINDTDPGQDMPIITPGSNLTGGGLGSNQYGKPSLGYLAVKDMLGDELFKKCLHEYMNTWNGKHPLPWDFFNTFNRASGKNLNWFWDSWFIKSSYIDFRIKNVIKNGKANTVIIENIGGMPAPFDLEITYSDNQKEKVHYTPEVWKANNKQYSIALNSGKTVNEIKLLNGIYMDANPLNNIWKPTTNTSGSK